MIKVYYKRGCNSSRKALSWFKVQEIYVKRENINTIKGVDIIALLISTDYGVEGLIKKPNKNNYEEQQRISDLMDMNFNAAISYLETYPSLFRTPIIIKDNKVLIGYNMEEIRKYIPKNHRRKNLVSGNWGN